MLVVLVIAGVLMSLASLSITRNPRTELGEEAQRVALLFETASDEAQVRSRRIEWRPLNGGYGFFIRERDGWQPLRDDLLAPHRWQAGVTGIQIHYAGASSNAPSVVFGLESIDTAVVVTLSSDVGTIRVVGNGDGRYEVH